MLPVNASARYGALFQSGGQEVGRSLSFNEKQRFLVVFSCNDKYFFETTIKNYTKATYPHRFLPCTSLNRLATFLEERLSFSVEVPTIQIHRVYHFMLNLCKINETILTDWQYLEWKKLNATPAKKRGKFFVQQINKSRNPAGVLMTILNFHSLNQ